MNFSYDLLLGIYRSILDNVVFSWSLTIAKAIAIIVVVIHYFKLYYKAFSEHHGYRIKPYDVIRPFIYLSIIAFHSLFFTAFDTITSSVEDSFVHYKNEDKLISQVTESSQESTTTTTAPPPANASERTAKSTTGILDYLQNPGLILFKILDWLVYMLDSVIFIFALILRFAFLFLLRFLAPFAIIATIFEEYNKFFWNWLKIYLIVFSSVFVFFIINTFCGVFYEKLIAYKVSLSSGTLIDINPASYMISTVLFCVVLVKTSLYTRSVKFMYQIFRSS
jgi:hypothetical protein